MKYSKESIGNKYRKFKKFKILSILEKKIVLVVICNSCEKENE